MTINRSAIVSCAQRIGVGLLVIAASVSCKKKDESNTDLQTLDNLSDGRRNTLNTCGPTGAYANDPTITKMSLEISSKRIIWDTKNEQAPLQNATLQAFAAVPPSMQAQFLATQGRFVISANANKLCTDRKREALKDAGRNAAELTALSEGLGSIKACYLYAMPEEASVIFGTPIDRPAFFVVLADSAAEIQHNLVRVFGYMNAQVSSRMYVEGDFTSASSSYRFAEDENPEFAKKRAVVAAAFLRDLKRRGQYSAFAKYADGSASKTELSYFEDFVYAEAFDSYFCSEQTLKVMARDFKDTLVAFVATLGQKQPAKEGAALTGGAEMALWGNPFTWIGEKWNSYTRQRDAIIDRMTADVMSVNGGKPPGFIDTVSIAANGAWRPVANAPVLSTYVRPAVNAADAIGGATVDVDASGQATTRTLTDNERMARGSAAVADVALSQAAKAFSQNMGTAGGDRAEALVRQATQLPPGVGREVVQGVAYHGANVAVKILPSVGANQVSGAVSNAVSSPPSGTTSSDSSSGGFR